MRYLYLLLVLLSAATAYADSAWLSPGSYQLICSHDEGGSSEPDLTAHRVRVLEKESRLYIVIDDQTAEVRNDESGALLFTIPIHPGMHGASVAQRVFVSKTPIAHYYPARVDGIYRTMWPDGGDKGRFALIPVDEKKG